MNVLRNPRFSVRAAVLALLAVATGCASIQVGEQADAPPAALLGLSPEDHVKERVRYFGVTSEEARQARSAAAEIKEICESKMLPSCEDVAVGRFDSEALQSSPSRAFSFDGSGDSELDCEVRKYDSELCCNCGLSFYIHKPQQEDLDQPTKPPEK